MKKWFYLLGSALLAGMLAIGPVSCKKESPDYFPSIQEEEATESKITVTDDFAFIDSVMAVALSQIEPYDAQEALSVLSWFMRSYANSGEFDFKTAIAERYAAAVVTEGVAPVLSPDVFAGEYNCDMETKALVRTGKFGGVKIHFKYGEQQDDAEITITWGKKAFSLMLDNEVASKVEVPGTVNLTLKHKSRVVLVGKATLSAPSEEFVPDGSEAVTVTADFVAGEDRLQVTDLEYFPSSNPSFNIGNVILAGKNNRLAGMKGTFSVTYPDDDKSKASLLASMTKSALEPRLTEVFYPVYNADLTIDVLHKITASMKMIDLGKDVPSVEAASQRANRLNSQFHTFIYYGNTVREEDLFPNAAIFFYEFNGSATPSLGLLNEVFLKKHYLLPDNQGGILSPDYFPKSYFQFLNLYMAAVSGKL